MIDLMLCLNDKHGAEDRLVQVQFGNELMTVETDPCDGDHFRIIGRWLILNPLAPPNYPPTDDDELFKFSGRNRHVGNVHWDCFRVAPVYACLLANYLSRLHHWNLTVWREPYGDMWKRKQFDCLYFFTNDGEPREPAPQEETP